MAVEVIRTVPSALFSWRVGSFPENGLLIYTAQVAVLPVRLLVFSALLAAAGYVVGLRTDAFVRAFRVVAYFHAVTLPIALVPGGLFSALAMLLAVGLYASIGLAAVHRTALRQGVAANVLLLVPIPCLFVALYQFFST